MPTGCDDQNLAVGEPKLGCTAAVCALMPSCCSVGWTSNCVSLASTTCTITCGNNNGTCEDCYHDSFDHDGDGYASTQGDCADCDPAINPGAYDFPNNGLDEDCSGKADDEVVTCDSSLAMASNVAGDYAKAIGLCRTTTAGATGSAKTWGVISSALVQANGTGAANALSYGILSQFGTNNLPQEGAKLAAFSSGTARAPGDPSYVNPNGQLGSCYNQGTSSTYPTGFKQGTVGCPGPVSGTIYDSSGLLMTIRVPTNAKSFLYEFNFMSAEYPEYVCTSFNDSFVAMLKSAQTTGNISFDAKGNPVTINNGFFTVNGGSKLLNTGFDSICSGQICGGGTDWLASTAPVTPGETITLQFSVWDEGDHVWDSIVLVDGFQWSAVPTKVSTFKPSPPPPTTFSEGWFTRDYDVSGLCPSGTAPTWGLWSWNASTPSDTSIDFSVATSATLAGLSAAKLDALQFSNPPGPSSLTGKTAKAAAGSPDTQAGSAVVDTTLKANGRARRNNYLRVVAHLAPSTDKLKAPTLKSWDLQYDCIPAQ
jgi:hypothetical protein